MALLFSIAVAAPAAAQSLYLNKGERGVEAAGGWSVGPSSKGGDFTGSFSFDGRVDVGVVIAHYTYTFDDGSTSSFNEYAPFARFFPVKQAEGRAQYLTRNLGLDLTTAPEKPWVFRFTIEEQAFRRETYRAARISVIRRIP